MTALAVSVAFALIAGTAGLTPAQREDLACLAVSKALAQGHRPVDPMDRYFLRRLRDTDAKRDWLAEAPDYGTKTYRDFMAIGNACSEKMQQHKGR